MIVPLDIFMSGIPANNREFIENITAGYELGAIIGLLVWNLEDEFSVYSDMIDTPAPDNPGN